MKIRILHNPRCSKSREALKLLEDQGHTPEIIEYLKGGLSKKFLTDTLKALGLKAKDVLRTKEEIFKELNLNLEDEDAVIDAILHHPVILERPIVIKEKKAVIGRPPENIFKL